MASSARTIIDLTGNSADVSPVLPPPRPPQTARFSPRLARALPTYPPILTDYGPPFYRIGMRREIVGCAGNSQPSGLILDYGPPSYGNGMRHEAGGLIGNSQPLDLNVGIGHHPLSVGIQSMSDDFLIFGEHPLRCRSPNIIADDQFIGEHPLRGRVQNIILCDTPIFRKHPFGDPPQEIRARNIPPHDGRYTFRGQMTGGARLKGTESRSPRHPDDPMPWGVDLMPGNVDVQPLPFTVKSLRPGKICGEKRRRQESPEDEHMVRGPRPIKRARRKTYGCSVSSQGGFLGEIEVYERFKAILGDDWDYNNWTSKTRSLAGYPDFEQSEIGVADFKFQDIKGKLKEYLVSQGLTADPLWSNKTVFHMEVKSTFNSNPFFKLSRNQLELLRTARSSPHMAFLVIRMHDMEHEEGARWTIYVNPDDEVIKKALMKSKKRRITA